MENKITNKMALVKAMEMVKGSAIENEELYLEKYQKMIDALDKKNGGKSKAKSAEDEKLLAELMEVLTTTGERATELGAKVGISSSKVVALLKPLVADGTVINTKDKKVSLYHLPTVA